MQNIANRQEAEIKLKQIFGLDHFYDEQWNAIEKDYKRIYSRSWLMANHFLASQYKFKNPEVIWQAEFSDPLIYDLSNKPKSYKWKGRDRSSFLLYLAFNYSWGPAATRALPSSLPVYLVKFLMKRADRSFAFSSQIAGSA